MRHIEGLDYHDARYSHDTSTWLGWSSQDQSCFFAALSRHSRLRADLVAYDCGKPESEVLLYLDSLDRGLANVVQVDQSDQDGRRKRGSREGRAKSAREMTESWIQEEEILAGHLIQADQGGKRMEEEMQTYKKRKIERSVMKPRVREEVEDRAERRRLRNEGLAELQKSWDREDWGRRIGWEKLGQLDKLTRPSWSEWYADRVHRATEKSTPIKPPDTVETPPNPVKTGHLSKHVKIAIDNAALEALLAVEKRSRSPQQRADLTKLLNRKRNRENTRLQKLLQAGKTEEEIKLEGGVDKAYLKSIGKAVDAESSTNAPLGFSITTKQETPMPLRPARLRSESRHGTPVDTLTVSEDDSALQDLRNMGLDTYLASENLDIINFSSLASQYTGPDIPLPILQHINDSVKNYLRQLVLQAILMAEASAIQSTADNQPQIESQHVEYAIAMMDDSQKGQIRVSLYPHEIESPEEADHVTPNNDDEPSLTDQEDNELDQGATDLDEKLDSAAELALWQAAEEFSLPDLAPDDILASRTGKLFRP
jgi:hypothetical protein